MTCKPHEISIRQIVRTTIIALILVIIVTVDLTVPQTASAYLWPEYDGNLKVPLISSHLQLDPASDMTYEELALFFSIYDCLFYINDTGDVLPNLAESYESDDQYGEFTFHLDKNAKFHDGEPVTADAVITAIQSNQLRIGQKALVFDNIIGMTAVDQSTVQLSLTNPDPDLPRKLAHPFFAVTKGDFTDQASKGIRINHFMGSGPFRIDSVKSSGIRLVRNERYHRGRAYLKTIDFQVVDSEESSFLKFSAGKFSMHRVPYKQYGDLIKRKGINIANRECSDTIILDFGNRPFKSWLIKNMNPQEIINVVMNHSGTGAKGILPDNEKGLIDNRRYSGKESPKNQIVLGYYGDPNMLEPIAKRLQAGWETAGIKVNIRPIDDYPSGICDVVLRIVKTMGQDSDFIWGTERYLLGAEGELSNSENDSSTPEMKEQQKLIEKARFFPLAHPRMVFALSNNVKNFKLTAGCVPDFWSISTE